MKRIHRIIKSQSLEIGREITSFLESKEEIVFAYLHGSFLTGNFRDIDMALFLTGRGNNQILQYELEMGNRLEKITKFPSDVRVLNYAPLPFRFNVIKNGILLFSKDERIRTDFECLSIAEYHDLDFLRKSYREEALGIEV